MKETTLKSVHIAFDDQGKASIQLQYAERLTVDGELIRENYLPHERFSLMSADTDKKAKVKTVLGKVAAAMGEKVEVLTTELEALRTDHAVTLEALVEAQRTVEVQDLELNAARTEIDRLKMSPEIQNGGSTGNELRALLNRLADWFDDTKAEHDLEGSAGYSSLWENVLKDVPFEEGDPLLDRLPSS